MQHVQVLKTLYYQEWPQNDLLQTVLTMFKQRVNEYELQKILQQFKSHINDPANPHCNRHSPRLALFRYSGASSAEFRQLNEYLDSITPPQEFYRPAVV